MENQCCCNNHSTFFNRPKGSGDSIIPFASGGATIMTTVLDNLAGVQALVGFGNNTIGTLAGGLIDISGSSSFAFSVPRDGIITSIAAYYSVGAELDLVGSTVTITAQMYRSATPNDSFAPVVGASCTLDPPLTGLVSVGAISSGLVTGLYIPVTAGTRLMFVLSARVTEGIDIETMLSGFVSGGLSLKAF